MDVIRVLSFLLFVPLIRFKSLYCSKIFVIFARRSIFFIVLISLFIFLVSDFRSAFWVLLYVCCL